MRKRALTEIAWAVTGIILAAILMGSGSGCSKPVLEGGQVSRVPEGFLFDANASAARLVFPEKSMIDQRGYFTLRDDDHCSIMITEYQGAATCDEATAARDRAAREYGYQDYGPVEELVIDGQPAWGWLITQHGKDSVSSYNYTAVVPYEEEGLTYTVEYYASNPRFRDPEAQKEIVQRFEVKRAGVSYGYVGLALALTGGFAAALHTIRKS
jgi:hypothetical protein